MITESVKADDGGTEGKWVALAIFVILAVAFIALPYHQAGGAKQPLLAHQVSIKDLPSSELAMVAELRLAHEEIRNLFQDNLDFHNSDDVSPLMASDQHWPAVEELEALWLPPFVKDKSWKHKGQHHWQLIGGGVYLGMPQERNNEALPVVLISKSHAPDIWFKPASATHAINNSASFTSSTLVESGWIQVAFDDKNQRHAH